MTTKVQEIFSADLLQPNGVFNVDHYPNKPDGVRIAGLSFETRLIPWDEPLDAALSRVLYRLDKYLSAQARLMKNMKLYFFAATNSASKLNRVDRHKRLWRAFPDCASKGLAIQESEEIEIVRSCGTCFAGVLELPMDSGLPDLPKQMSGSTAFYLFSRAELTRPDKVEELFERSVSNSSLDWSKMVLELCPADMVLIRGSGGFGDPGVAVDVLGLSCFFPSCGVGHPPRDS